MIAFGPVPSRRLVAVTARGTASGRETVRTDGARVDDHVLVTRVARHSPCPVLLVRYASETEGAL